ncbi:hypothetical protein BAE36_22395 [Rhizobium leguminosarum bv. trifolii]|nr:hypothetical protein BAE36_22395 [Rhizobium leguminosarum bv. trifolii]
MFRGQRELWKTILVCQLNVIHRPPVCAGMSALNIGQARISVDQRSFDLKYRVIRDLMPMDNVDDLEMGIFYRTYPLQFCSDWLTIVFARIWKAGRMVKNAIVLTFAHIKRFAVPRIDQSIDIVAQLLADLFGEPIDARHRAPLMV